MDNNKTGGLPQFSAEQIRSILGSKEGQKLLALLNRDGGNALRQAAGAVKTGDYDAAKRILEPVMQTPEAEKLVDEINRKQAGHG